MATAQNFPITLPYNSSASPYDSTHRHRGRDYGCPTGTPLVVGGQRIGLTGATGKVIGAHLHIQEWHGDYANTREPNNAFQPGTVTNVDLNGTQGDGSFGKFVTIQTSDGWNDTYCHLSEIDVQIGQVIGGEMPITIQQVDHVLKMGLRREPTAQELNNPAFQESPGLLIDTVWNNGGADSYKESQKPTGYTPVTEQLYKKG